MKRESTYPDILTVTETAMFLRCSGKSVLNYLKQNKFPNAYKIGKSWRIPKQDAIDYRQSFRLC